MNLTFTKNNDYYVAEFEATGDFNLHISSSELTIVSVGQDTTDSNEFDNCFVSNQQRNIDADFTGIVYPKKIKVLVQGWMTKDFTTHGTVTFA